MDADADCWKILARIAAHGKRLQASEDVARWTVRIIIESHMRSAGFTLDALRDLSAILGHQALLGIVDGLLERDAIRIVSAIEPRSADRAARDAGWARKRLAALVRKAGKSPSTDKPKDADLAVAAPVRVFSKHRSMGARRRAPIERAMLSEHLLEER